MNQNKFDGLIVKLASMEDIEKWSHGVVDNPDTVNYRTGKPKQSWLFCESIFWPVKNYECSCGKYKWVRYKGIVCERCGVEVTTSRVRRSRMGHIELAVPVIHVWYKASPLWWINQLLNLSANEIDKILSFVKYVLVKDVNQDAKDKIKARLDSDYKAKVLELENLYKDELANNQDKKKLKDVEKLYKDNLESLEKEFLRIKSIIADLWLGSTIMESDYRSIFSSMLDLVAFQSWPEAILKMLQSIDVEKEIKVKVKLYRELKSEDQKRKTIALIKLLINLHISGVKPENMVIRKLPVIPPDLRPVVQLEWGRFASSDVNLFYRRVLMRNIRLKKMIQVGMPDVVKKNEIRLLQESVNNLLVWEKNSAAWAWAGIKVFKSLSDMLSGKEWIFRKNLLGKRVDYSWRSIITVGPTLSLNECWLPIYIAVKMFTPFIIGKLIEKKIAYTPKQAEKMIKEESPVALTFLEEVIKDKYVLLNRAPTLHRLSIEAFKIKLMPGKTIRIHPLVCPAFNADFDWDQMAVHLPISDEAQKEARELIAADKNILKPGSWDPTITHSQDMVLWIYYLTDFYDTRHPENSTEAEWSKNNPLCWIFSSIEKVLEMYHNWDIKIKDKITLVYNNEPIETTVWRVVFNNVLPEKIKFINDKQKSKDLKKILSRIFDEYDMAITVQVADAIKNLWFHYSTIAATSINVLDMRVPKWKEDELKNWDEKTNEVYKYYYKWFFSDEEKHRSIIKIRTEVKSTVEKSLKDITWPGQDLYTMIDSWARWSQTHMTQISGMKWLVVNPKWEIIELPIKNSYVEWLRPIEYFISAHAWRKGKADTALRTADSWYLTRKLCDSSQEVIVRERDCWTERSLIFSKTEYDAIGEDFYRALYGRVVAEDIQDENWNIILSGWELLTKDRVTLIETLGINEIKIRTPLVCNTTSWVCQQCYGMDLSTRKIVDIWVPVWVIAAQSIWEPTTQLTMDTFHTWWVASWAWDMTQGVDRIKQLFEVRSPSLPAIVAPFDGTVSFYEHNKLKYIRVLSDYHKKPYVVKSDYEVSVKKGMELTKWEVYATKWKSKLKVQEEWKVLEIKKDHIILGVQESFSKALHGLSPKIKEWEDVYKGNILTLWTLDIKEYKDIVWDLLAQKYIIRETKKVYASQWQDLNDKHIEIIVKQLFSKVFIEDSGDSSLIPGTHVKYEAFVLINKDLELQGKVPAKWRRLALWLTNIAKESDSWLSAASFQETIRVMVWASLRGAIDTLSDLKSNVIIGRLLPVGGVYRRSQWLED